MKPTNEVILGRIGRHLALSISDERGVTGLFLGSVQSDYPISKTLERTNKFINRFIKVDVTTKSSLSSRGGLTRLVSTGSIFW